MQGIRSLDSKDERDKTSLRDYFLRMLKFYRFFKNTTMIYQSKSGMISSFDFNIFIHVLNENIQLLVFIVFQGDRNLIYAEFSALMASSKS